MPLLGNACWAISGDFLLGKKTIARHNLVGCNQPLIIPSAQQQAVGMQLFDE